MARPPDHSKIDTRPRQRPAAPPSPSNSDQAARRTFAGRLWAAAIPGDNHPPQLYLAGRLVWPPDGIGPGLPASVRWRTPVAADAGEAENPHPDPCTTA